MGDEQTSKTAYLQELYDRWCRSRTWALGGGLRGTAESQRHTLHDLTDRLLRLAKRSGVQCPSLQAAKAGLVEVFKVRDWADGPPYLTRSICPLCGALHRKESGPCSDSPTECDGEVEVLPEDGYVAEAVSAKKRLLTRLGELLPLAEKEARDICGLKPADKVSAISPARDTQEPPEPRRSEADTAAKTEGKRVRQRTKHAKSSGGRPSPEVIDQTAQNCLEIALKAAKEAGEPYVPSRRDITQAVSKALRFEIGIESLFGTKQAGDERVPRYPSFMELWKKVQVASAEARRQIPKHHSEPDIADSATPDS